MQNFVLNDPCLGIVLLDLLGSFSCLSRQPAGSLALRCVGDDMIVPGIATMYLCYHSVMSDDGKIFLSRLVKVSRLLARDEGAMLYEIMEAVGYRTRKGAQDAIDRLDDFGIPVVEDEGRRGRRKVYRLLDPDSLLVFGRRLLDVLLDEEESLLLGFCLESLSRSSAIVDVCGDHFLSKLSGMMDLEVEPKLTGSGNWFRSTEGSHRHLVTFLKACARQLPVQIDYVNAEGEEKRHKVYPLKCYVFEGGIYIQTLNWRGQVMTLSLYRIRSAELCAQEEYPQPLDDPVSLLDDPFAIVPEEEELDCLLRLDGWQASYEMAKAWPASVSFEREDDGSVLMRLKTRGRYWLTRWILSLGASVEVLEPDDLRSDVAQAIEDMGNLYR